MNNSPCPPEDDLLPLLTDDIVPPDIRSHVDDCSACKGRLARIGAELTNLRSAPQPRPKPPANTRPAAIGKYLIVGALDAGGQALVFRAIHPTLDKELVIKLSRAPVEAGSDDRDLLVREGKLLAKLEHPNLARVYDLDFHGDLPFLAMEYIRGRTLGRFAAEVPLAPRESARLVGEVAQALALVHRRGIIHQDIKPKNILVDDDGRARLIDFGMARLRHAWDGTEPFGGTPDYMAPEQARSEENRVTARSDVFSLGGVLFFLLTGQAPFAASTPEQSLERARKCDFDWSALDRTPAPRRLRDVCLRAMSADPEGRYGQAEDFANALDRASAPFMTRRQALAIAGGFTAVLAIVASPVIFDWVRPKPFTPDFTVDVFRDGGRLDLVSAKPLNPATDGLMFTGHVPPDFEAAIFWRKTDGSVERLPLKPTPGRGSATITYPEPPNTVSLKPGPGPETQTDVVFLAAGKSQKQLDEFEPLLKDAMAKLRDKLPAKNFLVWDRDRNEVRILSLDESRGIDVRETTQSPGPLRNEPALVFKEGIQALLAELQPRIPILLPVAFSY